MERPAYFSDFPRDSLAAIKYIVDLVCNKVYTIMNKIRNKLQSINKNLFEDDDTKIKDVYILCCSQIKKTILNLFDIFKLEHNQNMILQESRDWALERLSWCINKLLSIETRLEKVDMISSQEECMNDSLIVTSMSFVNWIDHAFDMLAKLSNIIYVTDYKNNDELYHQWRNDIMECVSGLHVSLDELLLSAITLCRYCLPADQRIVKARCQVVLREAKALLNELIDGDLETGYNATVDTLKHPIMPSNVNMLIDVLKDAIYVLEKSTHTALLVLIVHCFSNNRCPVNILKDHFRDGKKGICLCQEEQTEDTSEDCVFVKEFDLYNERLLQIGSFAVSCSSDQNRILSVRSGMASLEALDPYLVPSLMLSPNSYHSMLLIDIWTKEVQEIRDSVFLIVEPASFAEKSKQLIHHKLLDIVKANCYNNCDVCSVINMACMVHDFFSVYNTIEPEALSNLENLLPLLADLNKAQKECKIVSNRLCSNDDFVYDIKIGANNREVSFDQLLKRLKLLYTLVNRIDDLLHPKENDEQFSNSEICDDDPPVGNKNFTYTINAKDGTYLKNPINTVSRSTFARTMKDNFITNRYPLSKLTRHLQIRKCMDGLSFSRKLDELFNESDVKIVANNENGSRFLNKHLDNGHGPSVLYNFSPKQNRLSLRKMVMNKNSNLTISRNKELDLNTDQGGTIYEKTSLTNDEMSLEITGILEQMDNITGMLSNTKQSVTETTNVVKNEVEGTKEEYARKKSTNVIKWNMNPDATVSRYIWNIPITTSIVQMPLNVSSETNASNTTPPSNVTTFERINDLDFVESKLNSLKSLPQETSL